MVVDTLNSFVRFDGVELDLGSGELRMDDGRTVRLSEQPFRILTMLCHLEMACAPR
jgi:hypothetical protein